MPINRNVRNLAPALQMRAIEAVFLRGMSRGLLVANCSIHQAKPEEDAMDLGLTLFMANSLMAGFIYVVFGMIWQD